MNLSLKLGRFQVASEEHLLLAIANNLYQSYFTWTWNVLVKQQFIMQVSALKSAVSNWILQCYVTTVKQKTLIIMTLLPNRPHFNAPVSKKNRSTELYPLSQLQTVIALMQPNWKQCYSILSKWFITKKSFWYI